MPTYANTVPVMERHRFDGASLDRYLSQHLDGYRGGLEVQPVRFRPFQSDLLRRGRDVGRQAARLRAAQEAARQAGGVGPSGRPRVPRDRRAGPYRRAGGARPPALHRRFGDRPDVLPDGRGARAASWSMPSMPEQTPRGARGDLRFHERRAGAPAQGRPGRGRPRPTTAAAASTSPARWRAGASNMPSSRPRTSRRWTSSRPGCRDTSRAERSDDDRPWRLSAGQPDRASDRAAHRGRARLGAFDPRPSLCATSPTTAWAIICPIRRTASPMPTSPGSACRPNRNTSPPTAGAPAANPFRTGTTTSPSRCSGWPPSPRASTAAACRAIRPIPNRSR